MGEAMKVTKKCRHTTQRKWCLNHELWESRRCRDLCNNRQVLNRCVNCKKILPSLKQQRYNTELHVWAICKTMIGDKAGPPPKLER